MPEQLPKPMATDRIVFEMAKRIAQLFDHGFDFDPEPRKEEFAEPEVYFELNPHERAGSSMHLAVRRRGLASSREQTIEVAHYDPAQRMWLIYDDYADLEDMEALSDKFNQMREADYELMDIEARFLDETMHYDYWDLATESMRYQTREMLINSGLLTGLVTNNPLPEVRGAYTIDKFSSAYMSISAGNQFKHGEERLMVNYRGLATCEGRIPLSIPVARRTVGTDEAWQPNMSMLTRSQWSDDIAFAPHMLREHKNRYPKFSLARCAMMNTGEPTLHANT